MKSGLESNTLYAIKPQYLAIVSLCVATVAFSIGFLLKDLWYISILTILLAGLWMLAVIRSWSWVPTVIFICHTLIATAGFFWLLDAAWLIIGFLCALFSWDLYSLEVRYKAAGEISPKSKITIQHFRRLTLAGGLGILLVIITYVIQLEIKFGWLIGLGLVVAIGLSFVINYLMRTRQ